MTRPLRTAALAGALLAVVGGCSSPPVRYYTLAPTAVATDAPLGVSVAVGPATIPAVVDTQRIVLTVGPNELAPDDFNRWAAPLRDGILQTVAADLAVALGAGRVTLATNTGGPEPDYRVALEVERFDSVVGQTAIVEATWTVRRTAGGAVSAGRTVAREAVGGRDFGTLAAAHSRAVGRVSADIATAVRALNVAAK
jgi:uncharacterized lipoprotein YmbA